MKKTEEKELKYLAKVIAMVVRNNMETFHSKNLSDKQMKELNPLIRNGIYTGLVLLLDSEDSLRSKNGESECTYFMRKFQEALIPDYWEEPELTHDYKFTKHLFNRSKKSREKQNEGI